MVPVSAADRMPVHQCYFLGEETVDPVVVFTKYLVRNPQYARQRHADCAVHIYVVDQPIDNRLVEPEFYLKKVTTTMGAIRAAASALTGEDFNPKPLSPEKLAAIRAKKKAKQNAKVLPPA